MWNTFLSGHANDTRLSRRYTARELTLEKKRKTFGRVAFPHFAPIIPSLGQVRKQTAAKLTASADLDMGAHAISLVDFFFLVFDGVGSGKRPCTLSLQQQEVYLIYAPETEHTGIYGLTRCQAGRVKGKVSNHCKRVHHAYIPTCF